MNSQFFLKKILVDSTLSEHLYHHECNNIGTYKRLRCLFMMSNYERCTDIFVIMLKVEDGWVGQNQSERYSYLEICTEKRTIPYDVFLRVSRSCVSIRIKKDTASYHTF